MFVPKSTDSADDGDWVRDGLNEGEGGGDDDAEGGNDNGREYAIGDDYDGEERDGEDFGSDNEEEEDEEEDEEEEEEGDDEEGGEGEGDDDEHADEYADSSDDREENASSGQSDLDVWYAQDGVDFSQIAKLKAPPAAVDGDDNAAGEAQARAAAAAAAEAEQEVYNKEFERAALLDVLMRETPRPDDEATGMLKYLEACAASGAVPISRFTQHARAEEIDVHSRGICNRGLVALSAALETNRFMVRLRISANNIDALGFNALLSALAHNGTLQSVDVSENALGSQSTKNLATVLWASLPPSVLFWTMRRCKLRASDVTGLAATLQAAPRLQLLDVSDNSCGEAAYNSLMASVGDHENIAALRLQWNSLGIGSGRAAAAMLQKASCNLQLLDLSWNHLGDSGVAELCQGLKATATLRRLFLSHNNVSGVGCSALASVMHESGGGVADVLEELDLSHNNCSDNGVAALISAISINSRIHTLNLTKAGVGSAGAFKKLEALCGDAAQHNVTSLLAEYSSIAGSYVAPKAASAAEQPKKSVKPQEWKAVVGKLPSTSAPETAKTAKAEPSSKTASKNAKGGSNNAAAARKPLVSRN